MSKQLILPETGFVRLPLVLAVIPVGKSSWWQGVKEGRFPKPVKLGPRTTAWRAEDIRDLISHGPPSPTGEGCEAMAPAQLHKRKGEAHGPR
jgi:prophage regulatory protein